jgi:quercetin dioxygenase-like cupin family protein
MTPLGQLIMKWDAVKTTELAGGIQRQVLTTRNIMLVRHIYPPGTAIPHHTHPQEQITLVEEGTLYYEVEGSGHDLEPGDLISIPSNAKHGGQNRGEATVVTLNIFHPVLDYLLPEAKTVNLTAAQPPGASAVPVEPGRHKKRK